MTAIRTPFRLRVDDLTRALIAGGVGCFTGSKGQQIEACYLLVVHPDDEYEARGDWDFVPCCRYLAGVPYIDDREIGTIGRYRVIVASCAPVSAPQLYGAGMSALSDLGLALT